MPPTPSETVALARHREGTALLGMVVFVASWAMLFAGLFFAYGLVRARSLSWPPADLPRLPRGLAALATLVLGLASAALQRALRAARQDRPGARRAIAGAAGLGLAFVALQLTSWVRVWSAGLRPEAGTYGSTFFGLTVFHALHVLVGLGALAFLGLRSARRPFRAGDHLPLRLWTIYWHMVGIIWGAIFVLVYLL